ncbi:hypothetical protein Q0812_11880 [Brevundimonas sp. 2R-24]|uniref:Uncharacterized protein n=1 Tax=Peiella sedimenti TaxID=3061083 RepID=A0ABT8SNH0_9CAUL|nr:hypothetical protein [Caulobacteraceae bacterium XZ-24]
MTTNTIGAPKPGSRDDAFFELILSSLELIAMLGETINEAAIFQMELIEVMGLTGPAGRRVSLGEL